MITGALNRAVNTIVKLPFLKTVVQTCKLQKNEKRTLESDEICVKVEPSLQLRYARLSQNNCNKIVIRIKFYDP